MKKYILLFLIAFSFSLQGQDLEQIKLKNPVEFSGSFSANAGLSSISNGDADRTSPYFYSLNTRFSLSYNKISIPVYFSLRNHSFNYGATAPKFRINPKYKWAELQLGDVYMNFNNYTLSQRNLRGVGVILSPGKFKFKALYGKMQELRSFRDSLALGTTDRNVFSNKVLGMSIGIGTRSSNIDLHVLKSWTDIDSFDYRNTQNLRQDNVVVGSSGKIRIVRGLRVQYNFGLSFLTFDRDAIGETRPVGSNGITGSLLDVNGSTGTNYAGDVSINYSQGKYGVNGKISYIQPFYQPLTVAYINSDVINYTIGSYVSLFKNRFYINGNLGIQENNVSKVDFFTTKRFIYNIMANAKLHKNLSANITYNNFSQDLKAQLVNINDLYTYAVSTQMKSLSLTHSLKSDLRSITNRLSGGTSTLRTTNDDETIATGYDMLYLRWDGDLKMEPNDLTLKMGINYQQYDRNNQINDNYGFTIGVGKDLLDDKLSLKFTNTFNYLDQDEYKDGKILISNFSANYKIKEKSNILFSIFRIDRKTSIKPSFTEYRSRVSYQQRF